MRLPLCATKQFAPGTDIWSESTTVGYKTKLSGTSMATPHVTGASQYQTRSAAHCHSSKREDDRAGVREVTPHAACLQDWWRACWALGRVTAPQAAKPPSSRTHSPALLPIQVTRAPTAWRYCLLAAEQAGASSQGRQCTGLPVAGAVPAHRACQTPVAAMTHRCCKLCSHTHELLA